MCNPFSLHGVMLNILCPSLTLHGYHDTSYNNKTGYKNISSSLHTCGICQLNKDCRAEVALLVEVGVVVAGEPLVRVVGHHSKVLFVCGIYSVTIQPDSVILK